MSTQFITASSQYLSTTTPVNQMPLTVACWFYATSQTSATSRVLVDLRDPTTTNSNIYRLVIPLNTSILRAATASNSVFAQADTASGSILANTWMHAAGVHLNLTSRSVYLNGLTKNTNSTSLAAPPPIKNLYIGGSFSTSGPLNFFNGFIAEVGIWNLALTDQEIISLSKGITPDKIRPQNLVFYAPLIRDLQDTKGGLTITNNNTATVAAHPRIYS